MLHIFLEFFSKKAAQALDVWAMSAQILFMLRTLGAQNITKKRYMKCIFCLGLEYGILQNWIYQLKVVGPGESDF